MKNGPEFRFSWRGYQQRVLNELDEHWNDDRLHLVAAPGSGKTVLGLEVALRLKRPSLILVPTLTIRQQWIERFQLDFCKDRQSRELIACKLDTRPQLLVQTYQWLHSRVKNDSISQIAELLDDNPSLILDEAHHLKLEWWRSLKTFREKINIHKIVALTATPPIDSSSKEWSRYHELCGAIDAEISIPELVLSKDLCPHQDFVYLSEPTKEELQKIKEAAQSTEELLNIAYSSRALKRAVLGHPFIGAADRQLEKIAKQPELFSAMLSFLSSSGIDIRMRLHELGEGFSINTDKTDCLELLLNDIERNTKNYFFLSGEFAKIKRSLHWHKNKRQHRFRFKGKETVESLTQKSRSKLQAIAEICRHEKQRYGVEAAASCFNHIY